MKRISVFVLLLVLSIGAVLFAGCSKNPEEEKRRKFEEWYQREKDMEEYREYKRKRQLEPGELEWWLRRRYGR